MTGGTSRAILQTTLIGCALLMSWCPAQLTAQTSVQPDPTAALLQSQPPVDTTAPVVATATFDPPIIRPGGTSTYRVTFNAMMDSIQWPDEIIAQKQLDLQAGGRGQILVPGGAGLQPLAAFNTRAHVTAEGVFRIPRFLVFVYGKPVTVPEAQLQVTADPATSVSSMPEARLEVSTTNAFVGQPIEMRLVVEGGTNGRVQMLTQVKLLGEGFITDLTQARQRVQPIGPEANSAPAFFYETEVTPIVPGDVSITAQGFTAGIQNVGPITITGRVTLQSGQPQYLLIDTRPATLSVRSVPQEGRLPGFSGAVGQFKLDSPALGTNVIQVGDPLTYNVRVTGQGALERLVAPPPPESREWKIYAGQPDPGPANFIRARGFVAFTYTLVPVTEKAGATPAIPFSYFDPETQRYVELNLPSLPVTVKPSSVPVNLQDLAEANAPLPEREAEPKLSGLAAQPGKTMSSLKPWQMRGWFPMVQLAPALLFAGLWWWDKRRRFLAAHPQIVLRRKARRALRREWSAVHKAASVGDTSRFATSAMSAMRVGCAPHYPAEPRALVSTDVLPLLSESDAAAHNAVLAVFATTNTERFAGGTLSSNNLLALRTDVDRVLAQLEERLK